MPGVKRRLGLPRVVLGGVDAVEDAREDAAAASEDVVESLAKEVGADLIGIGRADGRDAVGVVERAAHVVDSVAPGQLVARGRAVVQAEDVAEHTARIDALELEIVDREDGLDVAAGRPVAVDLAEIDRAQRRVPVVAVEDVRAEVQVLDGFADRLGEERDALSVVKEAVGI